ncbi:MAG TPA: flippase [Chitinispirillaceae bacterium]|nr:flippase [Chitinispirillaceae bacterium]
MDNIPGKQIIKNSALILFNTGFMMLLSWAISIWIARKLGPSDYGIFNLVLWLSSTISWAVGMGLIHAITKFIAEYKGKNNITALKPIIVYVLKIELLITAITTIILIFLRSDVADFFFSPNESFYFFLTALGLIPGMITAVFSAAIEGIQKFEYFTYSNLIIAPASFASKVIVLLLGKGISGLLLVMLVFSCINAVFYGFVLYRERILSTNKLGILPEIRKRILAYNKSIIAILLCDKIVWDKSENFFLGRFCNSAEIGYYNLGYNLTQKFMSVLPAAFWKVLFPKMSSYCGSDDKQKMKRLFYLSIRYLAFFSFPVGTAGIILSHQIVSYLYGNEFTGAQPVLQIIFFTSIISSLSNPGSAILYGFEKQSFIYKYGMILAIINIILDFFLIKTYGALGAAICNGITTTLGSVGGLIYTCKIMDLTFPFNSIFKILCSTVLMGITMQFVILQNNCFIGFSVSLLAGLMVYTALSIFLGTIEKEDSALLECIKSVLPGPTKLFISSFQKLTEKIKSISFSTKNL